MDKFLQRVIDENSPRENFDMVEGMAYTQNNYVMRYIIPVLKSFGSLLPDDMEYVGCELVSPEEEFRAIYERASMGRKETQKTFFYEITRSDLFLIKIKCTLGGEELPHFYLYLPYISRGGMLNMRGTVYNIMPVISDYIISLVDKNVFVKLLKDKLTFERGSYSVVMDGRVKNLPMVFSHIHHNAKNKNQSTERTTGAKATVIHYFLCKFGFTGMWEKFFNFVPKVGYSEINPDDYPQDEWVIFEPTGFKPPGFQKKSYQPPRIKLAIPRKKASPLLYQFISGFFYTIDHFSEYVDTSVLDNAKLWQIWLGHIYYTGNFSAERLSKDIDVHFRSVDTYIDEFVEVKLSEAGYEVKDFYDLLFVILCNIPAWTASYREINESLYYRYVDVLYYILYEVTAPIFRTGMALGELAKDGKLTRETAITTVRKTLSPKKIFDLTSTDSPNMAVVHVEYSGDNLYSKMTAAMNVQEMGEGVKRAKRPKLPHRLKNIHGTEFVVGSLFYLPKKTPSPLFRMSPYAAVNAHTGHIDPPEDIKQISLKLSNLITGKLSEDSVDVETIEVETDIES